MNITPQKTSIIQRQLHLNIYEQQHREEDKCMREANTKRGESESESGYKVSPLCFWETCSSVKQKCSDEEERQKIVWREGSGAKKI